jgi:hypothetical protein
MVEAFNRLGLYIVFTKVNKPVERGSVNYDDTPLRI